MLRYLTTFLFPEKKSRKKNLHYLQGDIFGAGVDTTATTLEFIMLSLCQHKEWQVEIYDEFRSNCEDDHINFSDLKKFPKLRSFIAEVQRLNPVVPLGVPHSTDRDLWIVKRDGQVSFHPDFPRSILDVLYMPWSNPGIYYLPKGAMIMCNHWHMNRDPKLWNDPETFDPKRFLETASDGTLQYKSNPNLMPFQVGRRRCIGEDFAKSIVSYMTLSIIRKFRLEFGPLDKDYNLYGEPHENGFTLSPRAASIAFKIRE